jgi:hypothetical protein
VFAAYRDIELSDVAINWVAGTRYYLNSEGFKTVTPVRLASLTMYAESQSGDGMPVRQTFTAVERSPSELPSAAALSAKAHELANAVTVARAAPIGEEYAGPVLVEGIGSPQFFSETLVQMMEARRPPDAENPRLAQLQPSPFLNRTGLRVMADAFVAKDTPSLQLFDGKPLAGSYVVDDEGVRATDVTLVDKGRLVMLLTGRTPQKNFLKSNGHGRAGDRCDRQGHPGRRRDTGSRHAIWQRPPGRVPRSRRRFTRTRCLLLPDRANRCGERHRPKCDFRGARDPARPGHPAEAANRAVAHEVNRRKIEYPDNPV